MVNFGENLRIDCSLSLDRAGLLNFCTETSFGNLTLFNNFNANTYFGQFGNSNYYYIKDWINLDILTTTPNITWDNSTSIFVSSCDFL